MTNILVFLFIGLVAGFLAGQIFKGSGFGLLWNIIIGVIGSVVGGFLFAVFGFAATSLIGSIISATIGAIVLLWILQKIRS